MKELLLLRSSRHRTADESKLANYHYPLTRRGELAAISIGGYMVKKAYAPDLVICASPTRTRQTLAHIWPQLPHAPELIHDFRIHLARGDGLLQQLHQIDNKFSKVLVISIAPGICDLAKMLCRPKTGAPDPFAQELPPSTLAVFKCDVSSWTEISSAGGDLVEIAVGGIF